MVFVGGNYFVFRNNWNQDYFNGFYLLKFLYFRGENIIVEGCKVFDIIKFFFKI